MGKAVTTITSDGKTVAADGLRVAGDEPSVHDAVKIERIGDAIVGFCGTWFFRDAAVKWWRDGAVPDQMPKTADNYSWDLLVFKAGGVTVYSHDALYPDHDFPYPFATGTGQYYARGALLAGANPRRAVEIAAACNIRTGGAIIELAIPQADAMREAAE